jgi:hypothetical protein
VVLTFSDLHDDVLVDELAQDPRTGCLAMWSITLVFVLPGLLDHEPILLGVGITLGCAAAFASGRYLVRRSPRNRARTSGRRPAPARFRPAIAAATRRDRPPTPCRTETAPRSRTESVVATRCVREQSVTRERPRPQLRLPLPRRTSTRRR